jgi:hypothetical protein
MASSVSRFGSSKVRLWITIHRRAIVVTRSFRKVAAHGPAATAERN